MSVFVNLISEGYEVQPLNLHDREPEPPIATQEFSERCVEAARAYGPSFFEYLNKNSTGDP